jgi:Rieske 2Fe-2S family protein
MTRDDAWIDDLVAAQRPGWSLDSPFYTDPAIFQRDRKCVFARQWIMAGHVAQIPGCGDYFLFDIAGDNLILIRAQDNSVHALFNVCRHRGSRVLLETSGKAKSLICTYHGWRYAQDGSLRAAPRMPDNFDPACFGLRQCHVEILEGLIFICLAKQNPPDFTRVGEGLAPFLRLHGSATTRVARRQVFPVSANWKLVVENYLECYHCKPAHREYCEVEIKAEKMGDSSAAGLAAYERRMAEWRPGAEARGTWLPEYSSHSVRYPDETFFGAAYRAPLRASHQTGSQDGQAVAPLLAGFSDHDGGETALGAGPCTYMLAYEDYLGFFQFIPRDAGHSDMIITWLVAADAVEGRDYDPERVAWLWRVTTEQDKSIVEANAAGVASPAYTPGPPSLLEGDVEAFRAWYLATIAPESAPPAGEPGGRGRYFPG